MLNITDMESGYGKKQVLYGISLEVKEGEIVALIGPNGAGKSTVLKTVCGLIPLWNGHIQFENTNISNSNPAKNVSRGITFAPQGSRVFADLTVLENLEIGGFRLKRKELKVRIEEMFQMFPILKERYKQDAGDLSGGEQQMLAIARSLIPKPKLLMLDEPSLGLSPNIMKEVFEKIVEINKNNGVSILMVEQKVREVLKICSRVYSLKLGRVSYDGDSEELTDNKEKIKELFL